MLSETEIKYVFNEPALRAGDILLMNSYHEGIRSRMNGCIYDHAAIYVGDAFLLESDGLSVTQYHIYSYGFKELDHACVLRLKNASQRELNQLVINARQQLGKGYSTRDAVSVPEYKDTDEKAHSDKTFCSRYVAKVYNSIGIDIVNNADYCEPDDFLASDKFIKLDDGLQPATEEMMRTVMQTQAEREKTDTTLLEAYQKFGKLYGESVQSFDDIQLQATKHPELDDEAIHVLVNDTKLFHFAEDFRANCAWFDNDDEFFSHFDTMEDCLFYIVNQFLHYDNTFLPMLSRNSLVLITNCIHCPHSRFMQRLRDGANADLEEAMRIRERLAYLYIEAHNRDIAAFEAFYDKFGFYRDYAKTVPVTDISFILETVMKYGFPVQEDKQ